MQTTVNQELLKIIQERTTIREYDSNFTLPEEDLMTLLKTTFQAPSSWNVQPWKLVVIQSKEQKEKLLPIAYNQKQVVESSVMIGVLGDLEADKNAELVYGEALEKGFMNQEVKDTLMGQIKGAYQSNEFSHDTAIMNASLAAMQLMLTARTMGYDTCPMGGYDKQKFVEAFHVPERYIPVMLIAVGKKAKDAHATSRLPLEQVTVWESFEADSGNNG